MILPTVQSYINMYTYSKYDKFHLLFSLLSNKLDFPCPDFNSFSAATSSTHSSFVYKGYIL